MGPSLGGELSWAQTPTLKLGTPQQIVGESSYQDALEWVATGRNGSGTRVRLFTATVDPQPDNPVDPDAIAVRAAGRTLGYVPRDRTARFRDALARLARGNQRATCRAELTGGWVRGPRDRGTIGLLVYTGPQPTVWTDNVAFLPRSPWYDELPLVPLGDSAHAQPPDRAVVTLAAAQDSVAVRQSETWIGHVVGRPDITGFVQRIAALGLPTTAEVRRLPDGLVIRLADPDVIGEALHSLGTRDLPTIRRTTKPTGRWVCVRCGRVWFSANRPQRRWYDLQDESGSPHVCPNCWSYAFTHPY